MIKYERETEIKTISEREMVRSFVVVTLAPKVSALPTAINEAQHGLDIDGTLRWVRPLDAVVVVLFERKAAPFLCCEIASRNFHSYGVADWPCCPCEHADLRERNKHRQVWK